MSAAPLLLLIIAAQNENNDNAHTPIPSMEDESMAYLSARLHHMRSDKDFLAFYKQILQKEHTFYSYKEKEYKRINLSHLFQFLSLFQTPEQTVHTIKAGKLFKMTLDTNIDYLPDFISATGRGAPFREKKEGQKNYYVERDLIQYLPEITAKLCRKQEQNECPLRFMREEYWTFRDILNTMKEKTYTKGIINACIENKSAPLILATLMATKSKEMLGYFKTFLETSRLSKDILAPVISAAKEKAKEPIYQNLLIKPCPAFITRKKGWFNKETIFDADNPYVCPIFERTFAKTR